MRGNGRVLSGALVSAGVCSALTLAAVSAGAGPAVAAPASAARPTAVGPVSGRAASGTVPVIIFLKNQWAEGRRVRVDQRAALVQAAQAPYLGQLRSLGATDVLSYRLVNAIAARVPASALGPITASPGVASVIPDSPIMGPAAAIPAPALAAPATTPRAAPAGRAARPTSR